MDPLSAFLAQLLGQPIGSGSIVPNVSGSGPATTSVGSALPGLSYSPFANAGSPYALGGSSSPSIGSPVGTASPFLEGSIFNQLFPSSVNQATPGAATGGGGSPVGMAAAPSGTANLLNMAAPTGGEMPPSGGGGDVGVGVAAPGESGGAINDGGVAAATGSSIASGANQGLLSFLGDALGMNPTVSLANGQLGGSLTSGVPGSTFSLSNLAGLLGTMFAGPMFGLANAAGGGLAAGLQGLSTRSGDFSGPLGGLFGNATPSAATNYAGFNNSLSDVGRTGEVSGPFSGTTSDPSLGTAVPGQNSFLNSLMSAISALNEGGPSPNMGLYSGPELGGVPSTYSGLATGVGTGNPGPSSSNFGATGPSRGGGIGDPGEGVTGPTGPVGVPGEGMTNDAGNAPGPAAAGPAPGVAGEGMSNDASDGGGGAGGSGDGGSLLCTYCLGNGSYDGKTADDHRKVFGGLAGRALKDPAMKESFGHYQQASRQILDKIDTLDAPRRKAQLTDLHENLVKPFHAAAMRKDVKGAARILRDQTVRLAQAHGVTIPPEHLAAANKALGGGVDDGTAGA